MSKHGSKAPQVEPAPWDKVVLVCGKCLRKAGREGLRGELKRAFKDAGVKHVRPVETGCLDLCPKRAIAFARGKDLGATPVLHVFDEEVDVQAVVAWAVDR